MILRTNDRRSVNLAWVCEQMALVLLDEHDDDEQLRVVDASNDKTLFVCSFLSLKQLRDIKHASARISNNYERRRAIVGQQLAAGGNPG